LWKNLYFLAGRLVGGHWDGLHVVLPHASTQQLQRLPLANQELHEHAVRPRGVVMRQLMRRDKMREKNSDFDLVWWISKIRGKVTFITSKTMIWKARGY
jgi:hypothetical protein